MASDLGFVECIVGQIENAGEITYKKWISNLIRLTVKELPEPKPKSRKNKSHGEPN